MLYRVFKNLRIFGRYVVYHSRIPFVDVVFEGPDPWQLVSCRLFPDRIPICPGAPRSASVNTLEEVWREFVKKKKSWMFLVLLHITVYSYIVQGYSSGIIMYMRGISNDTGVHKNRCFWASC